MKLCFIGSGIIREKTILENVEVEFTTQILRKKFDTLIFGGSAVGLMGLFAGTFESLKGHIISVIPNWFKEAGILFENGEKIWVETNAERKHKLFDDCDAVICYPGGIGTYDELFTFLSDQSIGSSMQRPVYIYNLDKFYAPLLLQLDIAVESGLLRAEVIKQVHPYETLEQLQQLLDQDNN